MISKYNLTFSHIVFIIILFNSHIRNCFKIVYCVQGSAKAEKHKPRNHETFKARNDYLFVFRVFTLSCFRAFVIKYHFF
jgi:hypothetical protein